MSDPVVNVYDQQGQPFNVKRSELEPLLSQGFREMTPEEVRFEKLKAANDNPTGAVLGAASEAVNSASFGAFDPIVKAVDPQDYETMQAMRQANPTAAGIGTAAGLVPSVLGAPAKAITAAGQGVAERLAGESILSRAGAQLGRYGAEGVLASTPIAGAELITGHPIDAAESLLAGGLISTTLGGAVAGTGGLVGLAIRGAERGAGAVGSAVQSKIVQPVKNAVNTAVDATLGAARAGSGGVAGALEAVAPMAGEAAEGLVPKIEGGLDWFENSQLRKLYGMNKAVMRQLNKQDPQMVNKLTEFIKKKLPVEMDFDPEAQLINVQELAGKMAGDIHDMLSTIDASGKRFVDSPKLLKELIKIRREIPKSELFDTERNIFDKATSSIFPMLQDARGNPKMAKFAQLQAEKNNMWRYGRNDRMDLKPGKDVVEEIRQAIDGQMEEALGWAEKSFGSQVKKWKEAKTDLFFYNKLLPVLQDKIASQGNQMVSLSDMLFSIGGIGVGGLPGAAVGFGLNTLREKYGPQAGVLLARGIRDAMEQRDRIIGDSVEQFLNKSAGAARYVSSKFPTRGHATELTDTVEKLTGKKPANKYEALNTLLDRLAILASNPAASSAVLGRLTGDLHDDFPEVGATVNQNLLATVNYLQQEAPGLGLTTPFSKVETPPSDQELAQYERKLRIALNPYSILEDLNHGAIDPDSISALKALYPATYTAIRRQLIDKASEKSRNLGFDDRLKLSILFDTNIDSTISSGFMQRLQQSYQQEPEQPSPSGKPVPDFGNKYETNIQRVSAK